MSGLATDGTRKLSKRDQLRTVPWVLAWATEELGCQTGLGTLRGAGSRGAGEEVVEPLGLWPQDGWIAGVVRGGI